MSDLTFTELTEATKARANAWGGSVGMEFRAIELGGETGECLNKVKKYIRFLRGMKGGVSNKEAIADEIGDVVICASLLANEFGFDLGEIVARKFDETTEKYKLGVPPLYRRPVKA